MKLRIRVSTCAFRVPIQRGRIGQERGIYAASTRALQSAQRFAGPSEILARFGVQASACAARNFASASALLTLKRPEGRAPGLAVDWGGARVVARAPVASKRHGDGSRPRVPGCYRVGEAPVPLCFAEAFTKILVDRQTVVAQASSPAGSRTVPVQESGGETPREPTKERGIYAASACALPEATDLSDASPLFTLKRPEGRAPRPPTPWRAEAKRRRLDPFSLCAFTLIELLTVIAIIGILAALVAPVFIHFTKPDVTEAATRQMLDDVARARQLAISQRSTVYMVFIPTNFWNDSMSPFGPSPGNFNRLQSDFTPGPSFQTSTIVTQMYGAQWTGYMMESLRSVGDQPGNPRARDLQKIKTLPDGAFFAPLKFDRNTSVYPNPAFVIQTNFPIWRFLITNNIPFPSVDVLTNSKYQADFKNLGGFWLPYIAFNYLGQLTPGDGSVLPYDEYIPLAYGKLLPPRDARTKAYIQGLPNATEVAAGGSTNISYNLIHIDRFTGRARVERQDAL